MPEISDEELRELQQLRSRTVAMELDVVKANFRAENPHIPAAVLEHWQGSPDDFKNYGESLRSSFPVPQAQPVATPQAPAQPDLQLPNPAQAAQQQVPQPVAPSTPPQVLPAANTSPEAQRLAYEQAMAQGQPAQMPGVAPVPTPGIGSALPAQNADAARAANIRDQMAMGMAKPVDVLWLSQYGDKGFVAAMTGHARKLARMTGAS